MSRLDQFASYLPRRLVERVALRGTVPDAVSSDHFEASALFADITGFTPLAESLAKEGPRGAERLTEILEIVFTPLIDRVLDSGGDIMLFAGDAILAVWPTARSLPLDSAARMAVRCALACQDAIHSLELPDHDARLSMRIGVGAGECAMHEVGGVDGRWLAVPAGPALVRMGRAEKAASPGDVVVADEVFPLVEGAFELERIHSGFRVLAARDGEDSARRPVPDPPEPPAEHAVRAYVADSVLSRIDADQTRWMAELRTVSSVFVQLPGLTPTESVQVTVL